MPSAYAHCITVPNSSVRFFPQLPVALTSIVMKTFEKAIKETVSLIDGKLDPLQFAYQAGNGVDAKLFILDKVYKHLEEPKSHARILSADFSSAFNKMQAHILIGHLASHFKLPDQFLVLLFLQRECSMDACPVSGFQTQAHLRVVSCHPYSLHCKIL